MKKYNQFAHYVFFSCRCFISGIVNPIINDVKFSFWVNVVKSVVPIRLVVNLPKKAKQN